MGIRPHKLSGLLCALPFEAHFAGKYQSLRFLAGRGKISLDEECIQSLLFSAFTLCRGFADRHS